MTCCAHALPRRGSFWHALSGAARSLFSASAGSEPVAATTSAADEALAAARRVLDQHVSVDVHSHAGPTGITSRNAPGDDLARGMRAGRIAVVCLADVPDWPVLGVGPSKVLQVVREPKPDQLYQFHLDRLAWTDTLVAQHGIRRVLTA